MRTLSHKSNLIKMNQHDTHVYILHLWEKYYSEKGVRSILISVAPALPAASVVANLRQCEQASRAHWELMLCLCVGKSTACSTYSGSFLHSCKREFRALESACASLSPSLLVCSSSVYASHRQENVKISAHVENKALALRIATRSKISYWYIYSSSQTRCYIYNNIHIL